MSFRKIVPLEKRHKYVPAPKVVPKKKVAPKNPVLKRPVDP